ncbi:MAG: type I phosphomannose isomerase catalytic subunit [Planctomycetota bacterium]
MQDRTGPPRVPIKLNPEPVERVWGGTAVSKAFGWAAPKGMTIGEWWTLSFRHDHPSRMADGRFAGIPLPQLTAAHPELLGKGVRPELLIKFLDSADRLSVQVHPDDAVAEEMGLESGKTECWYYLQSSRGATIYHGIKDGVEVDAFIRKASENPSPDAMVSMINPVEVKEGAFSFISAGTVHAVGEGVFLMEVQQNSDTTFRIYDWGRPRELHLEEARKAILGARSEPFRTGTGQNDDLLVSCNKFIMKKLDFSSSTGVPCPGNLYASLICIRGSGTISCEGYTSTFREGDSYFLPARCETLEVSSLGKTVCIFSQQFCKS